MTITRADKYTVVSATMNFYNDFTTNLSMNPLTGLLAKVSNEESIKQSLLSLVLTHKNERFFQPWIGTNIRGLLFGLINTESSGLQADFRGEIEEVVNQCEPRVEIIDVRVTESKYDNNEVVASIIFSVRHIPDKDFSLDVTIQRVR